MSDGPYTTITVEDTPVHFKHSVSKNITGMSSTSALIVMALKELGQQEITEKTIAQLASKLTDEEKSIEKPAKC